MQFANHMWLFTAAHAEHFSIARCLIVEFAGNRDWGIAIYRLGCR
jgi:hypothetical protein